MEIFLKILLYGITAVIGIWQVWSSFKTRGGKVKKTILIYSALFIVVLLLTMVVNKIDDDEKKSKQAAETQRLMDSTKNLFHSTQTELNTEFLNLKNLNNRLQSKTSPLIAG